MKDKKSLHTGYAVAFFVYGSEGLDLIVRSLLCMPLV